MQVSGEFVFEFVVEFVEIALGECQIFSVQVSGEFVFEFVFDLVFNLDFEILRRTNKASRPEVGLNWILFR